MYSNILIPIDFDEDRTEDGTLEIARCLAAKDARFTLLHVMETVPNYAIAYMPEGYMNDLHDAVRDELGQLAAKLPNAEAFIAHGKPGQAILDWVEKHGIDCIIVGSHKPGLEDYFLGSTAARVVRHATCSVHVIR